MAETNSRLSVDLFDEYLRDCRELEQAFSGDRKAGKHIDQLYAPLTPGHPSLRFTPFLRTTLFASHGQEKAEIDLTSYSPLTEQETIHGRYTVSADGVAEVTLQDNPLQKELLMSWPELFNSPELAKCLQNFRTPKDEVEVDPGRLFEEVAMLRKEKTLVGRDGFLKQEDRDVHLTRRSIEGIESGGYEIDIKYERNKMPQELADILFITKPSVEKYEFVLYYQGKVLNKICLEFNNSNELKGVSDLLNPDPVLALAKLSLFKRSILN